MPPSSRSPSLAPPGSRNASSPRRQLWVYDSARFALEDASWPWGLVGRLFNNRGQSGTGALIGDRLVITARHMVPWGDSPWSMRFVPAYFNGNDTDGDSNGGGELETENCDLNHGNQVVRCSRGGTKALTRGSWAS